MKLEQQCVSLELAQKMKELGFKQESHFWWCHDCGSRGDYLHYSPDYKTSEGRTCGCYEVSAYTVAELSEIIPSEYYTRRSEPSKDWVVLNVFDEEAFTEGKTQADALAKALIKRHEQLANLI